MTDSRYNDYAGDMVARAEKKAPLPLENQVFISLLKTADCLAQEVEQNLRQHGLTGTQYNVLRILRGAEPQGLACREVGERMISHDPDMTRLLDRMEKRGLITRKRQQEDRRVVRTRVTPAGLALLNKLDEPIRSLHRRQFRHMPYGRLRVLAGLLDQVAAGVTK